MLCNNCGTPIEDGTHCHACFSDIDYLEEDTEYDHDLNYFPLGDETGEPSVEYYELEDDGNEFYDYKPDQKLIDLAEALWLAGMNPRLILQHIYLPLIYRPWPLKLAQPGERKSERNRRTRASRVVSWRPMNEEEKALFELLRTLRKSLAQERGVPPYVVFNDSTLVEMALNKPTNRHELLGIRGIGQKKLDEFGRTFLDAIVHHLTSAPPAEQSDVH